MSYTVEPADLSAARFAALVARHVAHCDGTAAPENCHRLEVQDLDAPDITVWQARDTTAQHGRSGDDLGEGSGDDLGGLLGMIALRPFSPHEGEIKSMHTVAEARGKGVARALLDALEEHAAATKLTALYLETGTHPAFDAARRFYAARGYAPCAPFAAYTASDENVFMSKNLTRETLTRKNLTHEGGAS